MKNYKRSDWIVMGGILILLLLVVSQLITRNHFRNNAGKWAKPSIEHNNIVKASGLTSLPGNTLIIDLSGQSHLLNAIHIQSKEILEKKNLNSLREHQGNIVLVSEDAAESARIWMILSQMGIKDLYILTEN